MPTAPPCPKIIISTKISQDTQNFKITLATDLVTSQLTGTRSRTGGNSFIRAKAKVSDEDHLIYGCLQAILQFDPRRLNHVNARIAFACQTYIVQDHAHQSLHHLLQTTMKCYCWRQAIPHIWACPKG